MFKKLSTKIHAAKSKHGVLWAWIAAITLITALATAAVIWHPAAARALTLATTKQPERFTELYFNDHQNLPKQVTAQRPAKFSYHVTNHEARDTHYHVRVSILENGQSRLLKLDDITLANNESKDITIQFATSKPGIQLELSVELIG